MSDVSTGHVWAVGEACQVTRMTGLPGDGGREPSGEVYPAVVAELAGDIVRGEVEAIIAPRGPRHVRVDVATEFGTRARCFSYRDGYDGSGFYRLIPAEAATATGEDS